MASVSGIGPAPEQVDTFIRNSQGFQLKLLDSPGLLAGDAFNEQVSTPAHSRCFPLELILAVLDELSADHLCSIWDADCLLWEIYVAQEHL